MPAGGGERVRKPLGGRAAVVVREGDDRRACQPPGGVAVAPGRRAAGRQRHVAQDAGGRERVRLQELLGLGPRRVMPDDDLELLAWQRLLLERVQEPAQSQRPVVRGDDDADLGLRAVHARAIMPEHGYAPRPRGGRGHGRHGCHRHA